MKNTISFLFLILIASCDNVYTVDAPWDTASIPVVFSIISPNAPVQVYLNKTYNSAEVVEKNPYPEATVFICGPDSNWNELTRLKEDTCVFVDATHTFTVEKGKTYSLKIELKNKTVHSQTTLPTVPGKIEEVTCTYKPEVENTSYSISINNKWVKVIGFPINLKCKLPTDKYYGYDLTAFANSDIRLIPVIDNKYSTLDFACPLDSSAFTLRLHTLDPNYKRYLLEGEIIEMEDFGGNPILAIIQKFGGVLPQFSNIENGVGLFSCYVTDSIRVNIINYPQQN